jgi:hypothetical protein
MADIAQTLVTGGTALVSAAAGAGLTYWLGALNRRHQDAREDRTRWYEARLKAYADFSRAVCSKVLFAADTKPTQEERAKVREELASLVGDVRLVGSESLVGLAERVFVAVTEELKEEKLGYTQNLVDKLYDFEVEARRDLGYDTGHLEPDPTPGSKDLGHP